MAKYFDNSLILSLTYAKLSVVTSKRAKGTRVETDSERTNVVCFGETYAAQSRFQFENH